MQHTKEKDKYIISFGIGDISNLIEQRKQGYNPGVKVLVKDAETLEVACTHLNLESIEEARPGIFQFTGIVSNGFRIRDYYYAEESEVEGYISINKRDVCPIMISTNYRQSRSYISPRERKNHVRIYRDRALYQRWKHQSALSQEAI